MMKKLLLVGNGDTNRSIMQSMKHAANESIVAVLVDPSPNSSATPLQRSASPTLDPCSNVRIIFDELAALDAGGSTAILRSGYKLGYDFISLNTGGETDLSCLALLGDRLLPLKPLNRFYPKWRELICYSPHFELLRLVVVADDTSMLPMVASVCQTLKRQGANFSLVLVLTENTDNTMGVQQRAMLETLHQSARFALHHAQVAGTNTGIVLSNGIELRADRVIVAANTRPPPWLEITPLCKDSNGFVVVDDKHRSVSHHNVFVSGDMAAKSITCGGIKSSVYQGGIILDAIRQIG